MMERITYAHSERTFADCQRQLMKRLALSDETRTAAAENFGWVCVCSVLSRDYNNNDHSWVMTSKQKKMTIEDFSLEVWSQKLNL